MRIKRDPIYRMVIGIGYSGAITLIIFSKLVQFLIVVGTGALVTLLFWKLIK